MEKNVDAGQQIVDLFSTDVGAMELDRIRDLLAHAVGEVVDTDYAIPIRDQAIR